MGPGIELTHMGGEIGPGVPKIAAQSEARLAGDRQEYAAHMIERGGNTFEEFGFRRVAFAAIGRLAMMQVLRRLV